MDKGRTERRLGRLVDKFNDEFPVGTQVILRKDSGDFHTMVAKPAFVLGGHSAVAFFERVSGAYSIEDNRVKRCPAEATL